MEDERGRGEGWDLREGEWRSRIVLSRASVRVGLKRKAESLFAGFYGLIEDRQVSSTPSFAETVVAHPYTSEPTPNFEHRARPQSAEGQTGMRGRYHDAGGLSLSNRRSFVEGHNITASNQPTKEEVNRSSSRLVRAGRRSPSRYQAQIQNSAAPASSILGIAQRGQELTTLSENGIANIR